MANLFLNIYSYFASHRKIFFTVLIALFAITGFFSLKIKPEEDISKILPKDRQTEKLNQILQNARFADKIVVMVSMKDSSHASPETQAAFSDSFSASLRNQYPGLIRSVDERVSDSLAPQLIQIVTDHLPVFLEPGDYAIHGQPGGSRKTEGNIVERSPDAFITGRICNEVFYNAGSTWYWNSCI